MVQTIKGKGLRGLKKYGQTRGGMIGALLHAFDVLRSYWKLVLLLGLGLSVVLVLLVLLLPVQYSKRTNLAISTSVSEVQARVGQGPADVTQTSNQAVTFLEQGDFGQVTISPTYNPETQNIEVQAESESRKSLTSIEDQMIETVENSFAETYEGSLSTLVETQVSAQEAQVEFNQGLLADIEKQVEDLQSVDPEDTPAVVRLAVLESKRLDIVDALTAAEGARDYFVGARKDLPRLARVPTAVEVANESAIQRTNQRLPAAAFAIFLSFVVAVVIALRVAAMRNR